MNNNKLNPMALMSEFGVSGFAVVAIVIWVIIARAQRGIDGVKRVGWYCAILGLGGGVVFGYTPSLATCAGLGILIVLTAIHYPSLLGGKKEK